MLYLVDSRKSLARIREDLPRACAAHKFGVLGVHDLKDKMREKGVEFGGECLIFEVCNPMQAKRVLEAHAELSTALPCRISVYVTREGTIRLATILPTKLVDLFRAPALQEVAAEVERTLKAIMDEAAR
jgi:uncharacterized protein (DUF302 family)